MSAAPTNRFPWFAFALLLALALLALALLTLVPLLALLPWVGPIQRLLAFANTIGNTIARK